jgi:hypothetical protein
MGGFVHLGMRSQGESKREDRIFGFQVGSVISRPKGREMTWCIQLEAS